MSPISIFREAAQLGNYRIFEIKNGVLVIERTNKQGKSTSTTIDLARVSLPSIRAKGRNTKTLKGSIYIIAMLALFAMTISSWIEPGYKSWIWVGALIIASPFFLVVLQSLRSTVLETFKDAQGNALFDIRCAKGGEEEFDSFIAGLKAAMQPSPSAKADASVVMPVAAAVAGSGSPIHSEGVVLAPPPLPRANFEMTPEGAVLIRKIKGGAGWLYLVAALTGINVLLTYMGANWRFAVGLGITDLINGIGLGLGTIGMAAGVFFTVVVLGCLVGLGYAAAKRQSWAFILGIIALVMDTLLLVALTNTKFMIGIILHVLAIVYLCVGYNALRRFNKLGSSPSVFPNDART